MGNSDKFTVWAWPAEPRQRQAKAARTCRAKQKPRLPCGRANEKPRPQGSRGGGIAAGEANDQRDLAKIWSQRAPLEKNFLSTTFQPPSLVIRQVLTAGNLPWA